MALAFLRPLTILLILAAAFPPPAIVNLWIASAPLHDSSDARKEVQARGRNRIGSPLILETCQVLLPVDGGRKRPVRPDWFLRHQINFLSSRFQPETYSPNFPTTLRLRC